MLGVLLWTDGAAELPALHLRRDLRCNHKTAWLLEHRVRDSVASYMAGRRLTGPLESDSTAIGGKVRKANHAANRKKQPRRDMSKVTTLSVLRERGPKGRVVPFLGDESQLVQAAHTLVDANAEFFVDEHPAWNALCAQFRVRQIKHKDRYSDLNGTSTNLAESYFSRFKRMYNGIYRHFSSQYAQAYNGECSFREEHRSLSNGEQFILMLAGALNHPPSSRWRGYYQRTRRREAA